MSLPASRARRVLDKTLLTQGLLRIRHCMFPDLLEPSADLAFPVFFSLLATSGFKATVRATPVSFHTVRPAAQRASLQVVAADKMTRPNLDHPTLSSSRRAPTTPAPPPSDRAPHQAHRVPHRSPYGEQEGLRDAAGSSHAPGSEVAAVALPQEEGPRSVREDHGWAWSQDQVIGRRPERLCRVLCLGHSLIRQPSFAKS